MDHRGIRPGDLPVLIPEALHDDGDVKAEHERHGDQAEEVVEDLRHVLEYPEMEGLSEIRELFRLDPNFFRSSQPAFPREPEPIGEADGVESGEEDEEVLPDQLVDGASPSARKTDFCEFDKG